MAGALELARMLVERGHAVGLAIAQKNGLEAGAAGPDAGFDLVIVEECARFEECGAYAALYERRIDIEYADALPEGATWEDVCAQPDLPPLTVLRDRDLAPAGAPGHALDRCP